MPAEQYEKLPDTVLAWKQRNKLGRFDPNAASSADADKARLWETVTARGIEVGKRCKVGERRGTVRFVGEVAEIPNGGLWVGIEGDEPTGKNDGSVAGTRYFTCAPKFGSFVRPDRVEVGDFPVEDDLEDLEEM